MSRVPLEYASAGQRTAPPLSLCVVFSVACLPALAVATLGFAVVVQRVYGGDFRRTLTIVGAYCGGAGLIGLLTLWLVAGFCAWLGRRGSRRPAWTAVAGAAYGLSPPPVLALAEGLDFLGGEVFAVALAFLSIVLPAWLAVWMTSTRRRRIWGFPAAAAIGTGSYLVTALTCGFLAHRLDENVGYPWRYVGAAFQRLAALFVLPVQAFGEGRASSPVVMGVLAANSVVWGVIIALIYRVAVRRRLSVGGGPSPAKP